MRMTFPARLFAGILLACLAAGGLVAAESYKGKTVTIYRKGKAPEVGLVVEENEKGIKIRRTKDGIDNLVPRDEIERVEVTKSVQEEYAERAGKCKTADDWVELAKWCGGKGLVDERKRCLDEAIKLEKDHAAARKERGDAKKAGKWVNEEEEKKAQGWVKNRKGEYVKKEDFEREEAERKGILKGSSKRKKENEGVAWAVAKPLKSKAGHYLVKCNSTDSVQQHYLKVMESLYKAYSDVLTTSTGLQPLYTDPGVIYIFRSREEFMDFCLQNRGTGGYFSQLDRSVRTYHGSFALTGNTDMVLAHEATHQFQHRFFKNFESVPFWVIEAMAVYFGDGSIVKPDKITLHQIPRDRLQTLQDAIEGGYYVKVRELVRLHRLTNFYPCYDHGWGLLFWLMQGDRKEFKYGHKGEGKKVWEAFLRRIATEMPSWDKKNYMTYLGNIEKEAGVFTNSLYRETGYKSLEEWEENYKKFVMDLKLKPLGKWSGLKWDGTEVGISLQFPDKLKRVEEKDLRQRYREAAAVTGDGGLRLWLSVQDKPDATDEEILAGMIKNIWVDHEYDQEFQGDEVKTVNLLLGQPMAVSRFKGKFRKIRESAMQQAAPKAGEKGGEKAGEKPEPKGKKAAGEEKKSRGMPDFDVVNDVRIALFSTPDRVYVITLAGPEGPFSKVAPKFDDVLKSVKLNLELQKK